MRGQPFLKVDASTRRNPSKFGYVLSNEDGKSVHARPSSTFSLQ